MHDPLLDRLSDDELVDDARRVGNDNGAYEELYRRHESAARNMARHILRSRQDADDVVNESFAGVIAAIGNGAGPRTNFRQYLMACVRNCCKSRRWSSGAVLTDPSVMEQNGVCFEDPDRLSEQGLVASAFSSLSADWQLTLWLTAVEERPTSEIAEQLGRRPGAVAALAHRAREAFAEAYLAQHQARNTSPACAKISPKIAHYVRGHSSEIDTEIVERHLVNCVPCSCAVDELRDLNASLRALTGPAPLLGAGLGAAGAGAALIAEAIPVTAGGWSLGALSGATLAKVAALAVILVPAAAVVSTDSLRTAALPSTVITVIDVSAANATTQIPGGAPTSSGSPSSAAAATPSGVSTDNRVTDTADAITQSAGDVSVSTLPDAAEPTVSSVPPVSIKITLPGGTGTSVAVSAAAVDGTVAAGVTVPVVTVPLLVTVSIPVGGTPAIDDVGITSPTITLAVSGVTVVPPPTDPSVQVSALPLPTFPSLPVTIASISSVPAGNVVPILQGILGGG